MEKEAIAVCAYVRYLPEGVHGDTHLGFVQGILGSVLSIYLFGRSETVQVTEEKCTVISPTDIPGGLVGLITTHTTFGAGEIVEEERIDNLLWVTLSGWNGRKSEKIPLTKINLCCSSC